MAKVARSKIIISLLAVLLASVLFLGTAYLWYGFWQEEKSKTEVEKSLEPEEDNFPKQDNTVKTTSTSIIVPADLASSTSSVKPIATLRTAVSPLTGTLVLEEGDLNLNVPYTSQAPERNWADPWQNACEEAAILMIDAYLRGYGLSPLSAKDELLRMVQWEEDQKMFISLNAIEVKKIFTDYLHYKKTVKIVANPTVEQIKQFLNEGKPVLALAHGKTLGNKYYSNGGPDYHAFVIRGYTKDKFITNDPGVNRGANFLFPIENIMKSLHEWNDGDVKNGQPVVIVIE